MTLEPNKPPDDKDVIRPEFEVWNHLWSGYDLAYHDLEETVGTDAAELFDLLGETVYKSLTRLFMSTSDPSLTARLIKSFAGLSGVDQASLLKGLFKAYSSDSSPVLKHSVDLQLAAEAIGRAQDALDRLRSLAELLAEVSLPAPVRQYLAEVVHTFLFGFDAASIALARSAFEQMARQVLVARGIYTKPRLKHEQPTAFGLLRHLKSHSFLPVTAAKAETLITRGNTISHRHMYEDRIMQQQAFTSISELVDVLRELASQLPDKTETDA